MHGQSSRRDVALLPVYFCNWLLCCCGVRKAVADVIGGEALDMPQRLRRPRTASQLQSS